MARKQVNIEGLERSHGEMIRDRERRLLAEGLCCSCGQVPATRGPRGSMRHCDVCREKQRQASKASIERRQRKKALAAMRREERERG